MEEKRLHVMKEKPNMSNQYREEIYVYEHEAENLEKEEADLLRQLEMTQERERSVFLELKSALMESSLPMKTRVSGQLLMDSLNCSGDEQGF